ncbi:hypothetical protein GCM10022251_04440 [Phytohabitans flavus]|uniref:Uncharacterized protein n=1 Tax=Phytohabitans flavus TaxID=1076124 RepID=A0A6F8Y341_9ACTN|nr:hypothetical protein [Phytohabitans flavus]BCB80398.1 hypothetical protein Pflav_068080 [Phytohabitans flavus]
MGALDVVITVGAGVAAALNGTIAIAILWRSRHQPDAIIWRRQRVAAPRWAAATYLFAGLTFGTGAVSDILFETGSIEEGLMVLAVLVWVACAIIAGIMWSVRGRQTTPH